MRVARDPSSPGYQTAIDQNGYGAMVYFSSLTCGFDSNNKWVNSGCITDYAQSDVKYVVDAWKNVNAPAATEARLISFDELTTNLGYEYYEEQYSSGYRKTDISPSWVYYSNLDYWMQIPSNGRTYDLVSQYGYLASYSVNNSFGVVRPVIVLNKSVLN